jgi:hypothetical protein
MMQDVCYYCGRDAHLTCDYIGKSGVCGRNICEQHSVPEFEDGRKEDFTLCKDHARYQHKAGETIRDYFARMESLS